MTSDVFGGPYFRRDVRKGKSIKQKEIERAVRAARRKRLKEQGFTREERARRALERAKWQRENS
jgi:hypothetical protein